MTEGRQGIICAGIAVADTLVNPVRELPGEGRLSLVEDISLHCGGCAVNTAIDLARLGIRVAVSVRVGSDAFGNFLREAMALEGVDTGPVSVVEGEKTSATAVMVSPSGERSFLHFLGANRHYGLDDFDFTLLERFRILHLGGALLCPALDGKPAAELFRRARSAGVTTSLDTCWDDSGRWLELVAPVLPWTDFFLPSWEEARMISGLDTPEEAAAFFLEKGAGAVAIKMGEKGSYYRLGSGESGYEPIIPVEKVVDTTGAGDAFVAGFLAAFHEGWPIPRCLKLANATGALAVTRLGATSGLLSLEETIRFAGL